MKAAVCTRYGPPEVVEVREVTTPTPRAGEVLIRVHAACVNSGDARLRACDAPAGMGLLMRLGVGFTGPRNPILGVDCAGVIESLGEGATRFRIGDKVVATRGMTTGTHAEFVTVSESGAIAAKPENLTMAQSASLLFGGETAWSFLIEKAKLGAGEHILINGATGAVGCAAIQIAKHIGAHVTAVCSAKNSDMARTLGADDVIDYTNEDFTQGNARYDIIMDNVGNAPWARSKTALTERGRLLGVIAGLPEMLRAPIVSRASGRRSIVGVAGETGEMVQALVALAEGGHLKPVIDASYPLDDVVAAHTRVDSGRKRGSVVLTFAP